MKALSHLTPERFRRMVPVFDGVMSLGDYIKVRSRPAMKPGVVNVAGIPTVYSDKTGLLHSVREIFLEEVYKFESKSNSPRIIDAGSNIGLSIRYFKSLYPEATIVGYEPDEIIFKMLAENVGKMRGVVIHQAAAWVENTNLVFYKEGSLAGSSEVDFSGTGNSVEVIAVSLKDEIDKAPVDFLKIDIEGAENSVLFDIESSLDNVENLFFEYHSSPDKPQILGDMLGMVSAKGFRYTINGAHGARLPFVEKVTRGFDLQLNVFCYR